MAKAIFQGTVEKVETRADRTIKITISTQEIEPDYKAKLFEFHQEFCEVLLSSNPLSNKEIDEAGKNIDPSASTNLKTPSQRLKNVLFLLFQQDNKGYKEFDSFYKTKMEEIINNFKVKLE